MNKLTHQFYLKRLSKSESPVDFMANMVKYWCFVSTRFIQAVKFSDPLLVTKP